MKINKMPNIEKKIKILHVDDEDDTLTVVKTILENEGYEVISINTGLNAIKEINLFKRNPHVRIELKCQT